MTAHTGNIRPSRVWTGFLQHDWAARLMQVKPDEESWVIKADGSRIARIDHFLLGKVAGRIEYAVIDGRDSLILEAAYYPLPWELLRHEDALGGFVIGEVEEQLMNGPCYPHGKEPDFSYMRCVRLHNHYGLFF